jgi:hypothetical protein
MATLLAFAMLVLYQERERRLSDAAEHVAQLSDVITRSTRFAMLQARPDYVHNIIDDVARQENIDRVRIFNKEGTIIDSTEAGDHQGGPQGRGCSRHQSERLEAAQARARI